MLAPQFPRGICGMENLAQILKSTQLSQTMRMQHHPRRSSLALVPVHTPLTHDTKLWHRLRHHPVNALLQLRARRCTSADRRSLRIPTRRLYDHPRDFQPTLAINTFHPSNRATLQGSHGHSPLDFPANLIQKELHYLICHRGYGQR